MPILSKNDIYAAIFLGMVDVADVNEINATSIDVRIGKLLSPAKERKDMREIPLIDNEYWLVSPGDFFCYETIEEFHLAPGFQGRIHSRSGWARYGVASKDADDGFCGRLYGEFNGKVICTLKTLGTTVMIRPGDRIAQAHLAYNGFAPVTDDEFEELIKEGMVEIARDGKKIEHLVQTFDSEDGFIVGGRETKGQRMNGGFTLTLDRTIKVYNGGVIDPRNPNPGMFKEIILDDKGAMVHKGTFFLSASAESVKIDSNFIGWVDEHNLLLVTSGNHGLGVNRNERCSSLQTHASAPKIDPYPRFCGKVTFENLTQGDIVLQPGKRLTELYIYPLNNPYLSDDEVSIYNHQDSAESSRSHLNKSRQLEFDF